eukprot:6177606-Pleurochrysis_carterae.AAC.1
MHGSVDHVCFSFEGARFSLADLPLSRQALTLCVGPWQTYAGSKQKFREDVRATYARLQARSTCRSWTGSNSQSRLEAGQEKSGRGASRASVSMNEL